ncbi:hypothetical protein GCM10009555_048310 [Acrocarpospora macrocephala]|uniref:Uncharacterized protein n=1 Tax=Acrocarpospora macrocephala TaxID=150177 RepID=A0A5M3X1W9_9ACTN|nr:hypothetical protein Amac_081890 [Acrocarpospora macrocephala]
MLHRRGHALAGKKKSTRDAHVTKGTYEHCPIAGRAKRPAFGNPLILGARDFVREMGRQRLITEETAME